MPPLLDRPLPGTKNPLHETQGKPAPVSLIAASQSGGLRHWLGRRALITVASPGPATVQFLHCSPADSPAHSRPALLPRFHRSGALWNPLWTLLFRFAVFRVQLLRRSICGLSEGVKCLLVRNAAYSWGWKSLARNPCRRCLQSYACSGQGPVSRNCGGRWATVERAIGWRGANTVAWARWHSRQAGSADARWYEHDWQ